MEKHLKRHVENNELYEKYANVVDSIQNALMREFPQLIQEYRLNMKQAADLEDFIDDRATMFRFLRKNNYSLPTTLSLLLDNIKWRIHQDIDNILVPKVEDFLQEPLVFFHGFDKSGRPILIVNLAYLPRAPEGCDVTEFLTPLVVFVLETARQLTWSLTKERELDEEISDPVILETAVLVNFKNANSLPMDISLFKSFLAILRRYPGMTGSVYFINFSWMYQGLWQMCKLVLSEEAKSRVSFTSQKELLSIISSEDLLADFGGDNSFSWSLENDDTFLKYRSYKASLSRRSSVSSLHSTYYDSIDTMNSPYLTPSSGNSTAGNSPRQSPVSLYGTPVSLTPLSLTPASSQTNLANVARAYSNLSLQSKLGPGIPPRLRSTFRTLGDFLLTPAVTDEVSSRVLTDKLNELKRYESESTEVNNGNNNNEMSLDLDKNNHLSFSTSSSALTPASPYSKPIPSSSMPPRTPQSWFVRLFWKFQDAVNRLTIRIAKKILKYRGTLSWVLACILLRNGVQEICQHILLLMMEIIVKGNTAGNAVGLQSFLSLTAGQMTL